jgi:hypothetical protein
MVPIAAWWRGHRMARHLAPSVEPATGGLAAVTRCADGSPDCEGIGALRSLGGTSQANSTLLLWGGK